MKAILVSGILLIVVGIAALAFEGIPYKKDTDTISVGPIQATAETTNKIPIPPILGGISLAGGVVMVIVGARKGARG